ncbi:MAG: metal-binding protein [Microcoleaceae cyanobacterium]
MPCSRTHDRITLWSLPIVVGLTYIQTRNEYFPLLVGTSFLFSGLMFGPDLDIYSHQFRRWGWLRWIWVPYQKSLRHRSFLSHGPLIGTAIRLVYLVTWMAVLGGILLTLAGWFGSPEFSIFQGTQLVLRSLHHHDTKWIAIYCGLELGSMSHYLMDWSNAAYKRVQTEGLSGLLTPTQPKKRKRSASKPKKIDRMIPESVPAGELSIEVPPALQQPLLPPIADPSLPPTVTAPVTVEDLTFTGSNH